MEALPLLWVRTITENARDSVATVRMFVTQEVCECCNSDGVSLLFCNVSSCGDRNTDFLIACSFLFVLGQHCTYFNVKQM